MKRIYLNYKKNYIKAGSLNEYKYSLKVPCIKINYEKNDINNLIETIRIEDYFFELKKYALEACKEEFENKKLKNIKFYNEIKDYNKGYTSYQETNPIKIIVSNNIHSINYREYKIPSIYFLYRGIDNIFYFKNLGVIPNFNLFYSDKNIRKVYLNENINLKLFNRINIILNSIIVDDRRKMEKEKEIDLYYKLTNNDKNIDIDIDENIKKEFYFFNWMQNGEDFFFKTGNKINPTILDFIKPFIQQILENNYDYNDIFEKCSDSFQTFFNKILEIALKNKKYKNNLQKYYQSHYELLSSLQEDKKLLFFYKLIYLFLYRKDIEVEYKNKIEENNFKEELKDKNVKKSILYKRLHQDKFYDLIRNFKNVEEINIEFSKNFSDFDITFSKKDNILEIKNEKYQIQFIYENENIVYNNKSYNKYDILDFELYNDNSDFYDNIYNILSIYKIYSNILQRTYNNSTKKRKRNEEFYYEIYYNNKILHISFNIKTESKTESETKTETYIHYFPKIENFKMLFYKDYKYTLYLPSVSYYGLDITLDINIETGEFHIIYNEDREKLPNKYFIIELKEDKIINNNDISVDMDTS